VIQSESATSSCCSLTSSFGRSFSDTWKRKKTKLTSKKPVNKEKIIPQLKNTFSIKKSRNKTHLFLKTKLNRICIPVMNKIWITGIKHPDPGSGQELKFPDPEVQPSYQ
jgi:hypothetical protein